MKEILNEWREFLNEENQPPKNIIPKGFVEYETKEGDTIRLRCAYWIDGKVYSKSMMWFYYYPQLIAECKRVQKILMFNAD